VKYRVAHPWSFMLDRGSDSYKFFLQRNRWTRGTIETLKKKKIGFNRDYNSLGTVSYPTG
jgi:cellulose synthase/poly-beta-1,6-N-acetylglucosamine synthase-like glycosyltransferase